MSTMSDWVGLTNLERMSASYNKITTTGTYLMLPKLITLSLVGNLLHTTEPFAGCPKLQTLILAQNRVRSSEHGNVIFGITYCRRKPQNVIVVIITCV